MNLLKKIGTTGALIGGLAFSGCGEIRYVGSSEDEQEIAGYMLGINAESNSNLTSEQRAAAGYAGRVMHERNVANEGRTIIIINQTDGRSMAERATDNIIGGSNYEREKNKRKKSMAEIATERIIGGSAYKQREE